MADGQAVKGLDGRSDLTTEELEATDRIVAMAGVHPYIKLLDMGAEVIIGGRSSDCVIFAGPAIRAGFPEALSYYLGKVLECASFCAEPYAGKETVIGEISMEDVKVTAMHPDQRCTVASVAGHAMYERSNPFDEFVAGGRLDMSHCRYEQYDPKTTRITGPRFIPAEEFRVKLEGSGKVRRTLYRHGRHPGSIHHRQHRSRDRSGPGTRCRRSSATTDTNSTIMSTARTGSWGDMEPLKDARSHELCVVVQGIAPHA